MEHWYNYNQYAFQQLAYGDVQTKYFFQQLKTIDTWKKTEKKKPIESSIQKANINLIYETYL